MNTLPSQPLSSIENASRYGGVAEAYDGERVDFSKKRASSIEALTNSVLESYGAATQNAPESAASLYENASLQSMFEREPTRLEIIISMTKNLNLVRDEAAIPKDRVAEIKQSI